jgi:hypothetical protein
MMPQANSKEAQTSRKRPALVAGLGAAFVASAVTLAMLPSTSPPTATAATEQPTKACKSAPPLMVNVFTENGGGTVRFREGNWLSPPIALTKEPQQLVFPRARSQTEEIKEVMTIEGQATDMIIVYPLTQVRDEYPTVNGAVSFTWTWLPYNSCQ